MSETVKPYSIINEQYFKAYSPIPNNYDISEVLPYFSVAEQLWVVDVLGVPLYNELLEQVNANEVTELNSTLLLKVYPYLSFAICYEALPVISYHFSAVGVTKGKSENSDSVSINDINYISSHLRNQIELMKSYLKKFLEDNKDLYPLYVSDNEGCECTHTDNDHLIWDYYFNGGSMDRYDLQKWLYARLASKHKPNPRCQLYSTKRQNINII